MVKELNEITFKELIFDYTDGGEWKFKGNVPSVIYFGNKKCRPCKMVAPSIEKLSEQYVGFVDFYKVNTDINLNLSKEFSVTSIPAILFIPMDGMPEMSVGALPKNDIEEAIKRFI